MDLRRTIEGRLVRLTSGLDDETRLFETELSRRLAAPAEDAPARELPWLQTHAYLELCPREFRLLQARDAAGAPSAQIAVFFSRPRRARWFATAVAERFGPAADGAEEEFVLRTLRELFLELGETVSLRLRPERFDALDLWNFEERARRAGFALAEALDVSRTMICDLTPSEEEILAGFGRKDRAKHRSKELELVEIRPLTDRRWIEPCRTALNAAFARTIKERPHFDFETTFSLVESHPDRAAILGLFWKSEPENLLAYAVGYRSGAAAEYSSSGSIDDPELRKLPFSYWLVWNLMLWAKSGGARLFDLRGITSGDASDPLAGISHFKRRFPGRETEINREMTAVLKPKTHAVLRSLRAIRGRRK